MLSDTRTIQQSENAGKTKLTAVTIGHGRHRHQFFVELEHNSRGEAILPMPILDKILDQAGVRRGDTYTVA